MFSHVVESFFLRVMKEKLTPSLTQKIKAVGIEMDVRIAERTGLEAWYELRRQPSAPS